MNDTATTRLSVRIQHAEPLVELGLLAAFAQHADLDASLATEGRSPEDGSPVDVLVTDLPTALQQPDRRRSTLPGEMRQARVLIITHHDREQDVKMALSHGVHGYLLLGCPLDEVVQGVRALARGERYLAAPIARRMAESLAHEPLTPREVEVLRRLTSGCSNKVIANELTIAVGTVKVHVKAIMSKLEADCRTHAASIAVQRGLCDLGGPQRRSLSSRRWQPGAGLAAAHGMGLQAGN